MANGSKGERKQAEPEGKQTTKVRLEWSLAGAGLGLTPVVHDVPIEQMRRSANRGRHPALMSASQRRRLCPGRDCMSRGRS